MNSLLALHKNHKQPNYHPCQKRTGNHRRWLPNSAQVGPIVVFVLAFIMLSVYWIILSPIVDQSIIIHNTLNASGIAITQERADAVYTLNLWFAGYLIFAVIVLVVWLLLQSLREREGGVF